MAQFIDGVRIYPPSEKAPSFVKGNGVMTVSELVPFLQGNHVNGKVRFQIKESKNGGLYMDLDTYVPMNERNIDAIKENINESLGLSEEETNIIKQAREAHNKKEEDDFSSVPF